VLAVVQLSFSPIVSIGDLDVRLETLGLAAVAFACLVLAVLVARGTPVDLSRPPSARGPEPGESNHLRADDLLYIAVSALPGAVAAGRLGYALLHLDYYRANPGALIDPGQGGLELALAVAGGLLTASIVAGLLGAPVGRWMHALVLPLLLALAAGKAALVLGGDGQGLPFDGSWAVAYAGPGPWGSLAPELASHPSQLYEAAVTAGVLLLVMAMLWLGAFGRRDGRVFLLGLALWAAARAAVAATWRDEPAVGPLNMGQLIAIGVAVGALVLLLIGSLAARARRGEPERARAVEPGHAELEWPDPATRPRF
jgi:prolipoprotein diacylglyceryltransferase